MSIYISKPNPSFGICEYIGNSTIVRYFTKKYKRVKKPSTAYFGFFVKKLFTDLFYCSIPNTERMYHNYIMAKKPCHTVLIAEDENNLQNILCTKFTEEGFTVITAVDGQETLDLAIEHHPDIIILDLLMPKVDGRVVLRKLRSDMWGKSVPVIVYTNVSETEGVDEIFRNKAYDYMVKANHSLEDVVTRVRQRLAMRAGVV